MRGGYPSATSNHRSPPFKMITVMVGLSQSVKVAGGSHVLNRKGALFAFVSLVHLMFTNSAEEWDPEECAQAVRRCLIFQNYLRKQNSTYSDVRALVVYVHLPSTYHFNTTVINFSHFISPLPLCVMQIQDVIGLTESFLKTLPPVRN